MIKIIEENVKKENEGVKIGDLVQWVGLHNDTICLVNYEHIVSLENPEQVWVDKGAKIPEYIRKKISEGSMKRLPSGTKVTVEYIQD